MPVSLPRWLYSANGEGVIVTTMEDYDLYVAQGWALRAVDVGFGARGDAERARQGIVQLLPEAMGAQAQQVQQMQGSLGEYTEELAVVQAALESLEGRVTRLEGGALTPEALAAMHTVLTTLEEQMEYVLPLVHTLHQRMDTLETLARTVAEGGDEPPRHERRRH